MTNIIKLEPPNEGPWDRFCARLQTIDPNANPMEVYVSIILGEDLEITAILKEAE